MTAERTLEQRVAVLEQVVLALQAQLVNVTMPPSPPSKFINTPAPNWVEQVAGRIRDEEAFDKALALGRAIREADRPKDDEP